MAGPGPNLMFRITAANVVREVQVVATLSGTSVVTATLEHQ